MKKRLKSFIGIMRTFGFYTSLLYALNKTNLFYGLIKLKLPAIRYPVYLRFRTTDFQLLRNLFFENEYDVKLNFKPQTIIDGGGNIGLASIIFANRYPDAKIVTIEPEEENYKLLAKNIAPYKNITSIKAAIWPRSSLLNINKSALGEWAFTVEESTTSASRIVKGLSIDNIISESGWRFADLIKLDIEGSEKEVFENNANHWLANTKAVIVEIHDWIKPGCSMAVFQAADNFQFETSGRGDNTILTRDL